MTKFTIEYQWTKNSQKITKTRTEYAITLLQAIEQHIEHAMHQQQYGVPLSLSFRISHSNYKKNHVEFWFDPTPEENEPIVVITIK